MSDFDDELESMIEGEHSEPAEVAYLGEYGPESLGEVNLIFDTSSIVVGTDGEAVLSDSPVVLVVLEKIETMIAARLNGSYGFTIRGKTYPVRVEPQPVSNGMARVELRRAID